MRSKTNCLLRSETFRPLWKAPLMIRTDRMAVQIAPAPVCWPLSALAETVTSDHASAACYRGPENIGVVAVVVAKFKLGNVQRQILGANFVERADHAALEDAPKAF